MRLFFQMLVEYAKLRHEMRCDFVRLKSELEIYVYNAKLKFYSKRETIKRN